MRLDRGLDVDELAGILEDAYAEVAPAKLLEAARAAHTEPRSLPSSHETRRDRLAPPPPPPPPP